MNNNQDNYNIRLANTTDVPAILGILSYYIINTTATWRYEVPDIEWMYNWYAQHQNENKPVWVACINDQVIGYASLSAFRAGEGYWPCAENSVYILPDYCDRGIGRKLLQQLINSALDLNIRYLIAGIDADNEGSIKFHESFGFKTNTVMRKIGFKFDRSLDLTLMILNLQNESRREQDSEHNF